MNHNRHIPAAVDADMLSILQQETPITVIDVRTPAEFEALHIPGSYNVPLDLLPEHGAELRDALRGPAVLVCRSGARAQQAEQVLSAAHLPQVHVLTGGISAWEAAGKPVTRGRQRWSLERQVRGVAGGLVLLGVFSGAFVWVPLTFVAAAIGAGLSYSALTDSCGMALLLSRLPYNQGATCDVRDVVARLTVESSS